MTHVSVPVPCAPFADWKQVWEFLAPHGFGNLIEWHDGAFRLSEKITDQEGGYLTLRGNSIEWTRWAPDA